MVGKAEEDSGAVRKSEESFGCWVGGDPGQGGDMTRSACRVGERRVSLQGAMWKSRDLQNDAGEDGSII